MSPPARDRRLARHRGGPRARWSATRPRSSAWPCPPSGSRPRCGRLTRAIEASAPAAVRDQGPPVAGGGGAARLHLRRPPADARRPAAARARGRDRADAASTRSGRCGRCRRAARPLQPVQRRVPARAQHRPRRRARAHPAEPPGSPDAPSLSRLPGRFVLVAADLSPSEAAELDWERVVAVVTDVGSSTYHTAIIARSLGIPAVVGLEDATRRIPPGGLVVVDGTRGEVVVEPSGPVLESFGAAREEDEREEERLQGRGASRRATLDGALVRLGPTSSSSRRRPRRGCTAPKASASSARSTSSGARCAARPRSSRSTSIAGCSSRCRLTR